MDDPLRVLRTIRFSTRFDFKIVDEIHEAISHPSIRESLATKVSVERIGKEIDFMFSGDNPEEAVEYFYKYKIFSLLLKFPQTCEPLQSNETVRSLSHGSLRICQILGKLFKEIKVNGTFMGIKWPEGGELKEFQKNLFYTAILASFRNFEYTIKKGKKSRKEKVVISYTKISNSV